MESLVTVRGCEDYDPARIGSVTASILDDLGGASAFFKPGDRVLLKPNLLMASAPEKAIVTHPAVVEAFAALVIDAGARPFIGDSPPLGKLSRILAKCGYEPFMTKMGIQPAPFREKRTVEFSDGRLFKRIDLADEAFQYDSVINLAKVKGHSQMFLTMAVKNLFGVLIGGDKAAMHLRAGRDYDSFATVLVQIYDAIRPKLSLVDGVLGMEGDGPNNGIPRPLGFIGASRDAVALDAHVCRLLGLDVKKLKTCAIAQDMGVGVADEDRIEVAGDRLDGFPLTDFQEPKSMTLSWNFSRQGWVFRFIANRLVPRPRINSELCSSCKTCLNHCPPQAICERDGAMEIDHGKCISCFCCQELCGNDAISISQPLLARLISKTSGR